MYSGEQRIKAIKLLIHVQAIRKGKASLLLSVARQGLFYIPILFVMSSAFGLNGLVFAQPMADFLALILTTIVLAAIIKKSRTVPLEEKLERKEKDNRCCSWQIKFLL